jgi:hypothetical protein
LRGRSPPSSISTVEIFKSLPVFYASAAGSAAAQSAT